VKHATTLANGFRGATLEWAKSSTAAARLAHAGSIGACRAYKQAATAIRCLARVDHLSRPEQLVGAQFVFDDAITPRPVGRWRLSDIDRSNSQLAMVSTAETVGSLSTRCGRGPRRSHAENRPRLATDRQASAAGRGQASARAVPYAPDRARGHDAPRSSARRHGRCAQMTVDRLSAGIRVGFRRRSGPGWSINAADKRKAWSGGWICSANEHVSAPRQVRAKS